MTDEKKIKEIKKALKDEKKPLREVLNEIFKKWEKNYSYESEMFAKAAKEAIWSILIEDNMKSWAIKIWINDELKKNDKRV